jgi:hypothetical protein
MSEDAVTAARIKATADAMYHFHILPTSARCASVPSRRDRDPKKTHPPSLSYSLPPHAVVGGRM